VVVLAVARLAALAIAGVPVPRGMATVPVPPSAVAVLPVGPGRWARLGSRRSGGRNRR